MNRKILLISIPTLFTTLFFILFQQTIASPKASIVVNSTADTQSNDGECTLREAMINANNDDQSGSTDCNPGNGADEITFSITTPATITLNSQLPTIIAGSSITVTGQGTKANMMVISGGGSVRVLRIFGGGTLGLVNLTIANGYSSDVAGGLLIYQSSNVSIIDSIFTKNIANSSGGAIRNCGELHIRSSVISSNNANSAGGGLEICGVGVSYITDSIFIDNVSEVGSGGYGGGIINGNIINIISTTFLNNTSFSGGGLYNSGVANIVDSTFSNNFAYDGGGIFNSGGELSIIQSTLRNNTANYGIGGALKVLDGFGEIENSTFTNNIGGGIEVYQGIITITNTTLTDNNPLTGGGLNNQTGTINLTNSILANSNNFQECNNISGTINDLGGNLVEDGSCGFPIGGDPLLAPLADNGGSTLTHALLPGSPALDNAVLENCPLTDQRGVSRPQGSGCDIGAFELEIDIPTPTPTLTPTPPSTPTLTPTPTKTPTPTPGSVYLPLLLRPIPCLPAASPESEPNDNSATATGPLCLNQDYPGLASNGVGNWDYYFFNLPSPGTFTVDITNHPLASENGAQVLLYYQTVSSGNLVGGPDTLPPYQLTYTGAAGTYYIVLYNDISKCGEVDCAIPYTLRISTP